MADEIETAVERPKTPVWFWIVGVVALIWNGFGAVDYTLTQMGNEAYLSAFTEEQLAFYLGFPLWYEAVWALAVWSAMLGSAALLIPYALRRAALSGLHRLLHHQRGLSVRLHRRL